MVVMGAASSADKLSDGGAEWDGERDGRGGRGSGGSGGGGVHRELFSEGRGGGGGGGTMMSEGSQNQVMLFVNDENDEPLPLCIERTEASASTGPGSSDSVGGNPGRNFMLSPVKKGSRVALRDTTFDIISHGKGGGGRRNSGEGSIRGSGGGDEVATANTGIFGGDVGNETNTGTSGVGSSGSGTFRGGNGGDTSNVISIVAPALNNLTLQADGRATEPLLFTNTNMGRWEQWKVMRSERELGCDASVKTLLRNIKWGTELQVQVVRPVQLAKELINQWSSLVIDQVRTRHSLQRELRLVQSDAEEAVREAQQALRALRMRATQQGAPSDVRSMIATPHQERQALFGEHGAGTRHRAGSGPRRLSPISSLLDEEISPMSSPSIDDSELPTATPRMRDMRESGDHRATSHYQQQLMGRMFESWAVAYAQTPPGTVTKKKRVVIDVPTSGGSSGGGGGGGGGDNDDDDDDDDVPRSAKFRANDTPRTRLGNALNELREGLGGSSAEEVTIDNDTDNSVSSLSVSQLLSELDRRQIDTAGVRAQLNLLEEEIADQRAFTRSLAGDGERGRAIAALQAAFGMTAASESSSSSKYTNGVGNGTSEAGNSVRGISVQMLLSLLSQHGLNAMLVRDAAAKLVSRPDGRRNPTASAPASSSTHEWRGATSGARNSIRTPSPPAATSSATPPSSASTPLPIELPASLADVTVSEFHKLCRAYGVDDIGMLRAEQVASDGISGQTLVKILRLLREQGELVGERDDKLAILSIRRMPLRFFTKVLLMSGKEAECAEVHTLVLAVAACMKGGNKKNTGSVEPSISDDAATQRNAKMNGPHAGTVKETPKKRYSSWYDSESSSSSSSDDDTATASGRRVRTATSPLNEAPSPPQISHRQLRLHRLRKHRQLFL